MIYFENYFSKNDLYLEENIYININKKKKMKKLIFMKKIYI